MDQKTIERAIEAAAKADYEALSRGRWDEQPEDFRDKWRNDVRPLVTAALAVVEKAHVEAMHFPVNSLCWVCMEKFPCRKIKALRGESK